MKKLGKKLISSNETLEAYCSCYCSCSPSSCVCSNCGCGLEELNAATTYYDGNKAYYRGSNNDDSGTKQPQYYSHYNP
jgi:putative bacteriocin precursor